MSIPSYSNVHTELQDVNVAITCFKLLETCFVIMSVIYRMFSGHHSHTISILVSFWNLFLQRMVFLSDPTASSISNLPRISFLYRFHTWKSPSFLSRKIKISQAAISYFISVHIHYTLKMNISSSKLCPLNACAPQLTCILLSTIFLKKQTSFSTFYVHMELNASLHTSVYINKLFLFKFRRYKTNKRIEIFICLILNLMKLTKN